MWLLVWGSATGLALARRLKYRVLCAKGVQIKAGVNTEHNGIKCRGWVLCKIKPALMNVCQIPPGTNNKN